MLLARVIVHRFVDNNQWLVSNCILLRIRPRSMEFRIIMKDYPSFLLTRCKLYLCYVLSQTSGRRQVEISSGSYILSHAKAEKNCIFLRSRNLSLDGLRTNLPSVRSIIISLLSCWHFFLPSPNIHSIPHFLSTSLSEFELIFLSWFHLIPTLPSR
jgi:hypothetical protein